jgi:K(+)-stimulated pyrophosphate-energized sodium pump
VGSIITAATLPRDALGKTTAATGKGFAIGSAVLTSLSLLNAFCENALGGIDGTYISVSVDISIVLAGVIIGAMLSSCLVPLPRFPRQPKPRHWP